MHLYMYTCVHSFFPYEQYVCFMIAISLYCVWAITEKTYEMFDMPDIVEPKHKEASKTRTVKDESDVQALTNSLAQGMHNPFKPTEDGCLINIVTGAVLPDDQAQPISEAKITGQKLVKDFAAQRLIHKTKDFYSPLQKYKLVTFESLNKPMSVTDGKRQ